MEVLGGLVLDEERERNSAAFSWMSAVVHNEEFSVKKAFSRFKDQQVSTQSLIDSAFNRHHLLKNGYLQFRNAIYRSRIRRFRRKQLLSMSLSTWLEHNESRTGRPVRDGAIVSACFKWITATIGAYPSQDLRSDYSTQGLLIAAQYPQLQPYAGACLAMHIPMAKVPLLLHAAAMLDAHLLQKHYLLWRRSVEVNKFRARVVERQHIAFLFHSSFRSWRLISIVKAFCRQKKMQQQLNYLKLWSFQYCVLKHNETVWHYCTNLSTSKSKRRAMCTLSNKSRWSRYYTNTMHHAERVKLRRDIVWALRRWRHVLACKKNIRHAWFVISQRTRSAAAEMAFGIWLLHAARRIQMKRNANTVIIKRFAKLSKCSFFLWKQLFLEHKKKDAEAKDRAIAVHDKYVTLKAVSNKKVVSSSWLVWCFRVKCRKFCRPLICYFKKLKMYAAFMKWNLIHNLSQIANCMQKIWRGYVVRHLTHRNATRYIRWILSGKLRTAMGFHVSSTKKKVVRHWSRFILSRQHATELYSLRVVQLRSLQVMRRSLVVTRRVRMALERGCSFGLSKGGRSFFSLIRVTVLLRRNISRSNDHHIIKLLKGAVMAFLHRRLAGQSDNLCTGRRLLKSGDLRVAASQLLSSATFVKTRLFDRWRARTFVRGKKRVSILVRENTLWRALSRWQGHHEKVRMFRLRYHCDPPEVLGHDYYLFRKKMVYLQLFRYRLLSSRGREIRRARAIRLGSSHFRIKALSKGCSRLRDCVTARRGQVRRLQRRYIWPVFKLWHREFRRNHYYSKKIFTLQVKIMRRISKNIILAWRLYAMKAARLEALAQTVISQRIHSLKERTLDRWAFSATEKIMQTKTAEIEGRIDGWIKLRAMRKWLNIFKTFQLLNAKSVRVTFFYWAKLVRDNKVTCRAVKRAEFYHCLRKGTGGLSDWRYITAVHRNLRLWEFESRKRMIVWKARVLLQYWRRKSWWLGRRVLWSRTRILHAKQTEKKFLSSSHKTRIVNFSASCNYPLSTDSAHHLSLLSSASTAKNFPRTAAFKSPLAHEAKQMRALRIWKKRVDEDTLHKQNHIFHTCFTLWKRYTCKLKAKRAAFVNRLQIFDRQLILGHVFNTFTAMHGRLAAAQTCRRKFMELRKRYFFREWLHKYEYQRENARQITVINRVVAQMTHKSSIYQKQLAFSTWRVFCRSTPNFLQADHMFLKATWESWRLSHRAACFLRRCWLQKCFVAWASRVQRLGRTRDCLSQMRRAAMMVEARLIKNRVEMLRFSFDKILAHVDMTNSKSKKDWKIRVTSCRSIPDRVLSPSGLKSPEGGGRKHFSPSRRSVGTVRTPPTASPASRGGGGVQSVLSRLTGASSSPYRPPSPSGRGLRFSSFLEEKSQGDSPVRLLLSPSSAASARSVGSKTPNLDISEL